MGVESTDVLAPVLGLQEAFHHFLAFGPGEVAGLAADDLQIVVAGGACSNPFLRSIAGEEPVVP